jgi:hypothetical protein
MDIGLYTDVTDAEYHADPAPEPSLSSSGAKVIVNRSPRAFRYGHPRLRPANLPPREEADDVKLSLGKIVHRLVLGRGADFVEVDAPDYRTKAAKEERDLIMEAGKTPILAHRLLDARAIARELSQQIDVSGMQTEIVGIWRETASDGTEVYCRFMADIWDEATLTIHDVKTTSAQLTKPFVGRQIGALSYDLSAAFYRRGMVALRPELAGRINNNLIFGECGEPFDTIVRPLTRAEVDFADRVLVQPAIDRFARCMATGIWPGAQDQPDHAEIPPWRERQLIDRELAEEAAA